MFTQVQLLPPGPLLVLLAVLWRGSSVGQYEIPITSLTLVATLAAFSRLIVAWEPHCDNIARRSRAETVIGKEPRAGVRLDMIRFVLLSLFIVFTTLLAAAPPPHHAQNQNPRVLGTPAPPPHHAQNQNPRVLGTPAPQAVAPVERSRALHDPHDSL